MFVFYRFNICGIHFIPPSINTVTEYHQSCEQDLTQICHAFVNDFHGIGFVLVTSYIFTAHGCITSKS